MVQKKNIINNENITHLFSLLFMGTLSLLVYFFAEQEKLFINKYYLFLFGFFTYEILFFLIILNYISMGIDGLNKKIKENKMILVYIIIGIVSISYLSVDYYIERNWIYTLRTALGLIVATILALITIPSIYNKIISKKKGETQNENI